MPLYDTLTKAHIDDAVAESNGLTSKKSIETVEIFLELIKKFLEYGEDVLIPGFGKFRVRKTTSQEYGHRRAYDLARKKVVTFHRSGS